MQHATCRVQLEPVDESLFSLDTSLLGLGDSAVLLNVHILVGTEHDDVIVGIFDAGTQQSQHRFLFAEVYCQRLRRLAGRSVFRGEREGGICHT